MTRGQREHVIRAAGAITGTDKLIIIGSQAILGAFPDAPSALLASMEADLYPEDEPDKADLIDGSIGEESLFHETFGYYAHGISPETAQLPAHWKSRVVAVSNRNTRFITGLCLHPLDIAVSKLLAGRPKDIEFVGQMLSYRLITIENIKTSFSELETEAKTRLEKQIELLKKI